jgi:hypothetical protein
MSHWSSDLSDHSAATVLHLFVDDGDEAMWSGAAWLALGFVVSAAG